jgi:hypothetical protein
MTCRATLFSSPILKYDVLPDEAILATAAETTWTFWKDA